MRTSQERFEELTAEAMDELPDWVRETIDNVEVIVEDRAPAGQPGLLGLYQGIPLTERGNHYAGVLPDRITLFRTNIERLARDDEELRELVAHTIVHEVAHHFGITDERLRDIVAYCRTVPTRKPLPPNRAATAGTSRRCRSSPRCRRTWSCGHGPSDR